jgi:hypothetical protein
MPARTKPPSLNESSGSLLNDPPAVREMAPRSTNQHSEWRDPAGDRAHVRDNSACRRTDHHGAPTTQPNVVAPASMGVHDTDAGGQRLG